MILNNRILLTCLVLSIVSMPLASIYAHNGTNETRGELSSADYKFAKAAASGGAMEVSLGKIAMEKSGNSAVQQFGQRMVTDHGKAGQDLAQVASSKGISLPSEPTASQQREIDKLSKLSGPAFDKAYMKLMVRDHKNDEKEFKHASENAQDADLKSFAATTLPVIQDHLRMAEQMASSYKHDVSMAK